MKDERLKVGRVMCVALAIVTAACTSVEPLATTAGDAVAPGTPTASGGNAAPAAGAAVAQPGGTGGTTGGAAGATTGAAAGATDPAGSTGSVGEPADLSGCSLGHPIRIGAAFSSDLATGLAIVGQPDAAASAGNYAQTLQTIYRDVAQAVTDAGGIGGCPVEPVFFDFSSLSTDGFDGQSQRECAYFTEDQPVFAVYSGALETNVVVECLAEQGVVSFFSGAEWAPIQRDFDDYRGYLYQPWAINTDRWGAFIDVWDQAGFFGDGAARVGILIADDGTGNGQRLAYDIWQPRLEALGIEVASTFEYNWIRSYATVADASTALSAAVLKFKADGVTHVLATPDGSAMGIFMTSQAESQGFRPAYGTTTDSGGPPLTAPDGQTQNWMTIAWDDFILQQSSTRGAPTDGNPSNAAQAQCDAIAAAVQPGVNGARRWCDTLFFLQAALRGAPELTPDALLAGAEALAGSYQVVAGYGGSTFGPRRYDGASQVRAARYDAAAGAFSYVTPVLEVP